MGRSRYLPPGVPCGPFPARRAGNVSRQRPGAEGAGRFLRQALPCRGAGVPGQEQKTAGRREGRAGTGRREGRGRGRRGKMPEGEEAGGGEGKPEAVRGRGEGGRRPGRGERGPRSAAGSGAGTGSFCGVFRAENGRFGDLAGVFPRMVREGARPVPARSLRLLPHLPVFCRLRMNSHPAGFRAEAACRGPGAMPSAARFRAFVRAFPAAAALSSARGRPVPVSGPCAGEHLP